MASPTPILPLLQATDATLLAYGEPPEGQTEPVLMAEYFAELELEYSAIRKASGLLDEPNRGVLVVTGADRLDFLNRMVTQEIRSLEAYTWRHSFWLNRKGRLDADMRVIALPDRTILEMDIHAVARARRGLEAYIIAEDVTLSDATQQVHRLGLHGRRAIEVLGLVTAQARVGPGGGVGGGGVGGGVGGDPPGLRDLQQGQVTTLMCGGTLITVLRDDSAGEVGLELFVPVDRAREVYTALVGLGHDHGPAEARGGAHAANPPVVLRPIGWHAYNIARIEAGTAIYNLDYGANNLPHETGAEVLRSRVSFKKGCYLGQEIVARMDARGHPKMRLVAIALDGEDARDEHGTPRQPVTGGPLFAPVDGKPDGNAEPVGAITSSTVSPMRSSMPVALAMVKYAMGEPGTKLFVAAEGRLVEGTVQERLAFWKRA
jgi:folate-binding protein YgfZ